MAANILNIVKKDSAKKSNPLNKEVAKSIGEVKLDKFNTIDGVYDTIVPESYKARKLWTRPDPKMIHSFIPGTITEVCVRKGDKVNKGDKLLMFNAMKMANTYASPVTGTIRKVHVRPGYIVPNGALLLEFEEVEIEHSSFIEESFE